MARRSAGLLVDGMKCTCPCLAFGSLSDNMASDAEIVFFDTEAVAQKIVGVNCFETIC